MVICFASNIVSTKDFYFQKKCIHTYIHTYIHVYTFYNHFIKIINTCVSVYTFLNKRR